MLRFLASRADTMEQLQHSSLVLEAYKVPSVSLSISAPHVFMPDNLSITAKGTEATTSQSMVDTRSLYARPAAVSR